MIKLSLVKFVFAFVLLATPALAQQQPATQPAEYHLTVTPAEVDVISKGLQTQPFGEVLPLINKLRSQIVEQQPKAAETPKPEKKE